MTLNPLRLPAAALALALFTTTACAWNSRTLEGSGISRTETRAVSGFNGLAISVPGNTEVTQGASESLSITADDNVLAEIETVVEGGTLKVRFKERNLNVRTKTKMQIVVGAKALESIAISGSGDVKVGPLKATNFAVSISGSGDAKLAALEARGLKVSIAGSGDFTAAGKVDSFDANIAGSGDVNAGKLATQTARISIAGSGDATLWASQSLKVNVVGSGDVRYHGDPVIEKTVLGSGRLKRLGATPG